jgi:hypothetical protein
MMHFLHRVAAKLAFYVTAENRLDETVTLSGRGHRFER